MVYRKGQFHLEQAAKRAAKALDMAQRYEAGSTLQEIGTYFGITRERVRQLISGELGMTGKDGGQAKRSALRRAGEASEKDRRCLAEHGMSREEYKRVRSNLSPSGQQPQQCFRQQRNNARLREIPWQMTFAEWWRIWQESGKWNERGRGHGYCMARHGDRGPYAAWNVKIIHAPLNNSEYIRRFWSEVRSGKRQPPKIGPRKPSPLDTLAIGQTMTLPITQRLPRYAQNNAYAFASSRGWKVTTKISADEIAVTRIQ